MKEERFIEIQGERFDLLMDAVCGRCKKRFGQHFNGTILMPAGQFESDIDFEMSTGVCDPSNEVTLNEDGSHPGPYFKPTEWLNNSRTTAFYPREVVKRARNPNVLFKEKKISVAE